MIITGHHLHPHHLHHHHLHHYLHRHTIVKVRKVKVKVVDRNSLYAETDEGWDGAVFKDKNSVYEK